VKDNYFKIIAYIVIQYRLCFTYRPKLQCINKTELYTRCTHIPYCN